MLYEEAVKNIDRTADFIFVSLYDSDSSISFIHRLDYIKIAVKHKYNLKMRNAFKNNNFKKF